MTTHPQAPAELADFDELNDRYRRELLAHCYRMSGSAHEAEDLVQETLLRAWRAAADFQGRSSVRTWLHRIATNVCLTNLEGRPRRPLPTGLGTADSGAGDLPAMDAEVPWLEPVPDAAVTVAERDTVRLAFVATLQHLPARQRAVLLLREVLRWSAAETADALDTTVAAVNSALQRARAQLAGRDLSADTVVDELDADQRRMLERYVDAFWRKDVDALTRLLTRDTVWEMPPFTSWYSGTEAVGWLIDSQCPGGARDMLLLPTSANGQPAYAMYMRGAGGDLEPFHLQVLRLEGDRVAHVCAFFDTRLFALFGLPERLPAETTPDALPDALLTAQPAAQPVLGP